MRLNDFLDRKTQKKIAKVPDYLKVITYDYLNTSPAGNLRFDLESEADIARFEQELRLYELNLRFVQKQLERLNGEVESQLKAVDQAKQALSQHKKIGRP